MIYIYIYDIIYYILYIGHIIYSIYRATLFQHGNAYILTPVRRRSLPAIALDNSGRGLQHWRNRGVREASYVV